MSSGIKNFELSRAAKSAKRESWKMGGNQSFEKFKALYVVKSSKQIEGFDYSETFVPSSKLETKQSTVRA